MTCALDIPDDDTNGTQHDVDCICELCDQPFRSRYPVNVCSGCLEDQLYGSTVELD